MGADYRQATGRRPRDDYGPRTLIPANSNSSKERFYGKGDIASANDNQKDESLPRGWSVLEPNRIKERRIAAGYATTHALSMAIGTMAYMRLHKIENGLVVVRDSEYELIARTMGIPVHLLQLPMLMHSQTVQWMELWGRDERLEEGGDHDAVLLAAYVRHHAKARRLNKAKICRMAKVPPNAMHYIWHAAKPIDRYPDTTMLATMKLTGNSSWDNVIMDSQAFYAAKMLTEEIAEIHKPRMRYAPEDPDRRAPWTYDVDPFRLRQPRTQFVNSYTDPEAPGIAPSKAKIINERRERTRRFLQNYNDAKLIVKMVREDDDPIATLLEYHPMHREAILAIKSDAAARMTLHRMMCIRYLETHPGTPTTTFARTLGITRERLRQLRHKVNDHGLPGAIMGDAQDYAPGDPIWSDFEFNTRKTRRAA